MHAAAAAVAILGRTFFLFAIQIYFRNHIISRPILFAKSLRLDTKTGISRYFKRTE